MAETQGQSDADMVTWFITWSSRLFTLNIQFTLFYKRREKGRNVLVFFPQYVINSPLAIIILKFILKIYESQWLLFFNKVKVIIKKFQKLTDWLVRDIPGSRAPPTHPPLPMTAEACGRFVSLWVELLCSPLRSVMASSVFPSLPWCICNTFPH